MSQPAFFLKELFCHVHTDRYRWKYFWGGNPKRKATEILFVSSWGTKAACLELLIHILGALAYLSNHQCSGRYSSYENWSLDCNASGSVKYCWSCCLGNSVLELLLRHYSCWTKLLWKLNSQEAPVCAADCDPCDRRSRVFFIFFLTDLFFFLSVFKGRGRKRLTFSHSNLYQ